MTQSPQVVRPQIVQPQIVQPTTPAAPATEEGLFEGLFDGDSPAPKDLTPPGDGGDEFRDLLQSEPPAPKREDLESLPAPSRDNEMDLDDSPSDKDDLFQNPFDGDDEDSDADKEDRRRLNERMDKRDRDSGESTSPDLSDPSESSKSNALDEANNCEDFRQRIAAKTIRTLSLDISPPFRPDVFDVEEFQELKGEFDAAQASRQWRTIGGQPMASGRFRDLAYEHVVIDTDEGSTQRLPLNRLSEGDLAYISENWGLPKECRLEQVAFTPRAWNRTAVTWKASNLCHKPLYFEEVNLERYGHTAGPILQPIVSSAHFFANIAVLPYKMGIHPPNECQYALGYYRPGDCAPWIVPPVPISLRGAAAQAAAVTTGFWLIP